MYVFGYDDILSICPVYLAMVILQLSWHPQKEGWLGFGTEDGRVGVLDVLSPR